MNRHPSRDIAAIANVAIVFKNGVGYDQAALLRSVRGRLRAIMSNRSDWAHWRWRARRV